MKNTSAAVEAYLRAVDINPCDYRSCQMILDCGFQWLSVMKLNSFICLRRQSSVTKGQLIVMTGKQLLYTNWQNFIVNLVTEEAAFYYKKDLDRMEAEEREGPNMVEALMFLAQHCKSKKRFEDVEVYCTRLLDYTGPENETAESLLRGIRYEKLDVEHFPP
ncbi:unnamed protein product [Fraxinus pennsylvanica]|uniref:Uncharacterized protein n=1 Tax=Fraxinus pennsylvanica TaxID=56036 RepID=A0AAD1YPD5_9LAMI|nr:unnamed protein product [Fraxinus pennsylvanica]